MKVHVANYYESERLSAFAGEAMPLGAICSIASGANGRTLHQLGNAELPVNGKWCIALKVSADPFQVDTSTVPLFTGDRTVSISNGDAVIQVRKAIVQYDASMVDASLDPARGGTLPTPLDTLGIKGALPCAFGAASANTHGPLLRCYGVNGNNILVEMLDGVVIA